MRILQWLLCVLSLLQCVTSEIRLVESGPGTVKPGETLDLVCTVTGASLTDSTNMNAVHWIHKDDRGQLGWMGIIWNSGNTRYASSLQGRMTLARDTNKGEVYCKLTGMKPEESGTYYCAREAGLAGTAPYWAFDIWGPGTGVLVSSVPLTNPTVFPMIPYGQEGKSTVTAGCLALKYYPMPATVEFSTISGEKVSGEQNVYFPLSGSPATYTLVSDITVSRTDWEKNTYQCKVVHYSSSIQKTIPKGCPLPQEPFVQLLQDSCPNTIYGQIELNCLASNLTTPDAKIQWFVNNKEVNPPQQPVQMGKANYHSLQSSMTISLPDWNRGYPVKCQVTDTRTSKSASRTTKKCSDNYNCLGIKVIPVYPRIEDIYLDNMAHIGCKAINLKQSSGYQFQWSSSVDISQANIQTEDPQLIEDGTYSVLSIISVTSEFWLKNNDLTCIFAMSGLPDSIITRISKKKETNLRSPSLALYPPSPEELSNKEMCSVTCNAVNFNPQAIYIAWKKNQMDMSPDEYFTSHPKQISEDGSPRYYVSSIARITCSEWEKGTVYTCIAAHEATPFTFTRKTIDKNSGNPRKISVSLSMCDTTLSCS